MSNRKYSKNLVDGPHQAASRSMLRGVGFETSDFSKPLVGIASTWSKAVSYTHLTLPTTPYV